MDFTRLTKQGLFRSFGVVPFAALVGFALVGASGCSGSKSQWEVTHPVSGVVTYKGNPVTDAELNFFPVDTAAPDSVRPRAKSTEGGKFSVWTYQTGDGIPAGEYKVAVVHNEVAVSKDTIVAKPNDLPAKYSRLDTTDLKVNIQAGKNEEIKIELK